MFKSIKWQLTTSFVLITFLTASVIGGLAYTLMAQYVENQQQEVLQSNAQVAAKQVRTMMWPVVQMSDLQSLVKAMSYLGNARVRILDVDDQVLADSGTVRQSYQFLWVLPSAGINGERGVIGGSQTMILPILEPELLNDIDEFMLHYELPSRATFRVIRLDSFPWGSHIEFQPDLEKSDAEVNDSGGPVVQVPITESGLELGYVEVIGSSGFGEETLRTTLNVILIATVGAVLLSALVGFFMSLKLARPINQLSNAASVMSEGDLTTRAPELGGGEIGHLSRQFNRMADSLETSFETLENERDTLRRFVADASHELRTPITALRNFNDLLRSKGTRTPQLQKEFLNDSKTQIDRLEWITDNLLNLSRLDAGITVLNRTEEEIGSLLKSVAAPFKNLAEEMQIDFKVQSPGDPGSISIDKELIALAVSNLLDNAFKFAAGNDIKIELGAERSADMVQIWVQDNGMGIDEEDLLHVFDRFYRGRNVNVKGSGLGLAMVKSVAEAHKGSVQVESAPGEGSRFSIHLPLN